MTEFHIIGLGNLCEFVIKDIDNSRTHGVFSACGKHARESMQEFIDYVNELIEENQALKQSDNITDLETEIMQLKEERKVFFEIVDSFIRGVESEKGIAPENKRFQYAIDQTLNWMTRLREDLKNPNQYLKLRKQLEKENKMFLVDKEKENNMF